MYDFLSWHRARYPEMQAQDIVKLMFQSLCGCGHLLADESIVIDRITQEESFLSPDPDEALTEPLGAHVRLNLRRAMAEGIRPEWIARLMLISAEQTSVQTDRKSVYNAIVSQHEGTFSVPHDEIIACARRLLDDTEWLPGHTERYRQAYHPAYRVISQRCAAMLPVLCALGGKDRTDRILLCIDGPCGSGKTTFSRMLSAIVDAAVVPMDDFFTPHAQKTPERLSQPGGNADIERFCQEVLACWLEGKPIFYRPYICWKDEFGAPTAVENKQITIIEGSYSLHPSIGRHAHVRVYLTVDPETQLRRLLARDGEDMLSSFTERWIPLEKAYASFFGLPDDECIVVSNEADV